jgi:hypothetical protein
MAGNKPPGMVLQARDKRLLKTLDTLRVIDREQAKLVAGFNSTTRANTRLLKLKQAGFLRRFFIGTSEGGVKAIYALSPRGAILVGVPHRAWQQKQDETLVMDLFAEHQLLVNSVFVIVNCQPIPIGDLKVIRWLAFREPLSKASPIIPDGYFEVESAQGVHPMFLEVDLGTESLNTWKKKIEGYLRLALSGDFSSLFRQARFRVLVIASSERRLGFVRKTVAKLTDKIFWFTTFELINRDGFWSAVWLRPKGDQRQSLL